MGPLLPFLCRSRVGLDVSCEHEQCEGEGLVRDAWRAGDQVGHWSAGVMNDHDFAVSGWHEEVDG